MHDSVYASVGTDLDGCGRFPSVVNGLDVTPVNKNRGVISAIDQVQAHFECATINVTFIEIKFAVAQEVGGGIKNMCQLLIDHIESNGQFSAARSCRQLDVDVRFFARSKPHAFSMLIADFHAGDSDRAGIGIGPSPTRWLMQITGNDLLCRTDGNCSPFIEQ